MVKHPTQSSPYQYYINYIKVNDNGSFDFLDINQKLKQQVKLQERETASSEIQIEPNSQKNISAPQIHNAEQAAETHTNQQVFSDQNTTEIQVELQDFDQADEQFNPDQTPRQNELHGYQMLCLNESQNQSINSNTLPSSSTAPSSTRQNSQNQTKNLIKSQAKSYGHHLLDKRPNSLNTSVRNYINQKQKFQEYCAHIKQKIRKPRNIGRHQIKSLLLDEKFGKITRIFWFKFQRKNMLYNLFYSKKKKLSIHIKYRRAINKVLKEPQKFNGYK